jgi:hypothetical protein
MDKKYQIFVSSTYEDLKEERDLVIKAILEMGHIPVGMEMFSAGDEEQWKLIQKQILDADYYVVIVAWRYGSQQMGISYTEKEYDFATANGIPTIGFIMNDQAKWPPAKVDRESEQAEKLNNFKEKIKRKLVSFWDPGTDLYGKVSIALMKQFNTNPRIGWIHADECDSPMVLTEISRLSKENADLRDKLQTLKQNIDQSENDEKRVILHTLHNSIRKLTFQYAGKKYGDSCREFTLLKIFTLLAPELFIEKSTVACSEFLGEMLNPDKTRQLNKPWPTPSNLINEILVDLNALDLVQPSEKQHPLGDTDQYWELTVLGKSIYKEARRQLLKKNILSGVQAQS